MTFVPFEENTPYHLDSLGQTAESWATLCNGGRVELLPDESRFILGRCAKFANSEVRRLAAGEAESLRELADQLEMIVKTMRKFRRMGILGTPHRLYVGTRFWDTATECDRYDAGTDKGLGDGLLELAREFDLVDAIEDEVWRLRNRATRAPCKNNGQNHPNRNLFLWEISECFEKASSRALKDHRKSGSFRQFFKTLVASVPPLKRKIPSVDGALKTLRNIQKEVNNGGRPPTPEYDLWAPMQGPKPHIYGSSPPTRD